MRWDSESKTSWPTSSRLSDLRWPKPASGREIVDGVADLGRGPDCCLRPAAMSLRCFRCDHWGLGCSQSIRRPASGPVKYVHGTGGICNSPVEIPFPYRCLPHGNVPSAVPALPFQPYYSSNLDHFHFPTLLLV